MSKFSSYLLIMKRLGFFSFLPFIICNNLGLKVMFIANFLGSKLYIRSATNDLWIAESVLCGNEYSNFDSDLLGNSKSSQIIDLGAHIGSSTIKLRKLFPNHEIISIEPNADNYAVMQKNLQDLTNVKLRQIAITGSKYANQFVNLNSRGNMAGFTIIDQPNDYQNSRFVESVRALTLSDLLSEESIGTVFLLKVDIEGAEKLVFSTDKDLAQKIEYAYVEIHDRIIEGCTETLDNFFRNTHNKIELPGEKVLYFRK